MFWIEGFRFSIIGSKNASVFPVPVGDSKIVSEFRKKIGIEVDIYSIDDTTCKTIIRTNPGFVRLKKGIIVEKFAL